MRMLKNLDQDRGGLEGRLTPASENEPVTELETWGFEGGDQIAAGLTTLRLLGGGTRYEAYLAVDESRLSTVVVKILRPDHVENSRALRGLGSERDTLQLLAHPSIPRCYSGELTGPRPHVVLEFIEGPRLSTLIRRYKALPLEQLIPLGVELAAALHYLHGLRIVHLDVKPQNIIMSGPPKLIDLSIARSFEDALLLDEPIGTDAYMAPEQCFASHGRVGPAADIWGLGATLFHAATGSRPFPKSDIRFPQIASEVPPFPASVPIGIGDLIRACMDADPSARPSARELSDGLEPFLAALPRKPVIGMLKPRIGRAPRR